MKKQIFLNIRMLFLFLFLFSGLALSPALAIYREGAKEKSHSPSDPRLRFGERKVSQYAKGEFLIKFKDTAGAELER